MITLTTNYQMLEQKYLGNSYGDLYVRIYAKYLTQEIANNRTKTKYEARAYFSGNWIRDNQGTGNVSGTSASTVTGACTYPQKGETVIATTEAWVTHDSDGTKSISASAYLKFPNWGWSGTATGTAELPTIPRMATIKDAPNFHDEENPTITYSNPAGSAVSALYACISLDGSKDDIPYREIPINGTNYKFELTEEERSILRKATTGSNSRSVFFYIKTEMGENTFYSKLKKMLTIIDGLPTLSPTVKDVNEKTLALTGDSEIFVRNQSIAEVSTGALTYKEAVISSQKVSCGSKSVDEGSGTIESVESGNFVFSVTDNRNNVVTQTVSKKLIEYVNLTCDLNITAPDAEGDLDFSITGKCFKGNFGKNENGVKVYYRYKVADEEYGEWSEHIAVLNDDGTYLCEISITGLDYTKRYTFQAKSEDLIMSVSSAEKAVVTIPLFDWGENDFNFNVPVNIEGDISIKGNSITDYIVEQGTSGIWAYRKWNSGIAECWTYSQLTFDTASAGSSGIEGFKVVSVEVQLPFDFIAYPSSTCNCAWSYSEWTECHCNEKRVLVRQFCNANSLNVATKWVSIQVIGRWK